MVLTVLSGVSLLRVLQVLFGNALRNWCKSPIMRSTFRSLITLGSIRTIFHRHYKINHMHIYKVTITLFHSLDSKKNVTHKIWCLFKWTKIIPSWLVPNILQLPFHLQRLRALILLKHCKTTTIDLHFLEGMCYSTKLRFLLKHSDFWYNFTEASSICSRRKGR